MEHKLTETETTMVVALAAERGRVQAQFQKLTRALNELAQMIANSNGLEGEPRFDQRGEEIYIVAKEPEVKEPEHEED